MPISLWALTISAFAIGTTEFVIVGLIPTIGNDLGVSLQSAGLLVSLYALGVALGAPILTAITSHLNRKTLLIGLMVVFTAGNVLAWLAPEYVVLVAARILTGMTHGVFFSVGATVAPTLVARDKAASAIALMFGGLTIALVVGVPLGTLLGQTWGWNATFLAVSLLGTLATLACWWFLPASLGTEAAQPLLRQFGVLREPSLLRAYAMTALSWGGSFVPFTYLAPMLVEGTGMGDYAVSFVLLVYGVSVAVGNIWGGKLADQRGPLKALSIIFALLTGVLVVLGFSITSPVGAVFTVLCWGAVAFGNTAGLQIYVVKQAERHVPHAVSVASGMNIAAFNVGIAGGAMIGGWVVVNVGVLYTPWVGAGLVFAAWLMTRFSQALEAVERT
jgi:predicted MFS family arabinose efflux permease